MIKVYLESPGVKANMSLHPQLVRGQLMLFDSYAIHVEGTEGAIVTISGSIGELEKLVKGMEDIIKQIKEKEEEEE